MCSETASLRQVTTEQAQQLATEHNLPFIETSGELARGAVFARRIVTRLCRPQR